MSQRKPPQNQYRPFSSSPLSSLDSSFETIDISTLQDLAANNGASTQEQQKISIAEMVLGGLKAAKNRFLELDLSAAKALGLDIFKGDPPDDDIKVKDVDEAGMDVNGGEIEEEDGTDVIITEGLTVLKPLHQQGQGESNNITRRQPSLEHVTEIRSSFLPPQEINPTPTPSPNPDPPSPKPSQSPFQRLASYLFPPTKTVRATFIYDPPETGERYHGFVPGTKEELWFHHPESWGSILGEEEVESGVKWREALEEGLRGLSKEIDGEPKILLVVMISALYPDDKEGFWKLTREVARGLIFNDREDGVTQFIIRISEVTAKKMGYFGAKKGIEWSGDSAFCRFTSAGRVQWMRYDLGQEIFLHAELELKGSLRLRRI